MAKCRLRILTVFFQIALVCAITWDAAPSTTFDTQSLSTQDPSQVPSATPAPSIVINGTRYEPPNLCGYVEYSSANSYTCGGNNTCLWNSNLGLVGCGSPTSIDYYTSCVPWRHMQDCNSSCILDPRILRCSTPTPYCVTPIVGPHHNYSMFGCEATRVFGRYHVHLTYSGQNTTGHLPRYLGDDHIITYGTRVPKNVTITTVKTTSTVNTNPFFVETIFVPVTTYTSQPTGWVNGNWTGHGNCSGCQLGRNRWEDAQIRSEIIAGSVIGGFMFLLAIGFGLWLFLAWRRLKRTKANHGVEAKDVRMQKLRDSVLATEMSGSTVVGSRTMSERTMSPSRELTSRGRDREGARSPVSPISEAGSAYMSRGTSTLGAHDDLYDDDDVVPRRSAVPLVVVSEHPLDESLEDPMGDLYDAEDGEPMNRLPEDIKEGRATNQVGEKVGKAEAPVEERTAELGETAAEPEPQPDKSIEMPATEGAAAGENDHNIL